MDYQTADSVLLVLQSRRLVICYLVKSLCFMAQVTRQRAPSLQGYFIQFLATQQDDRVQQTLLFPDLTTRRIVCATHSCPDTSVQAAHMGEFPGLFRYTNDIQCGVLGVWCACRTTLSAARSSSVQRPAASGHLPAAQRSHSLCSMKPRRSQNIVVSVPWLRRAQALGRKQARFSHQRTSPANISFDVQHRRLRPEHAVDPGPGALRRPRCLHALRRPLAAHPGPPPLSPHRVVVAASRCCLVVFKFVNPCLELMFRIAAGTRHDHHLHLFLRHSLHYSLRPVNGCTEPQTILPAAVGC